MFLDPRANHPGREEACHGHRLAIHPLAISVAVAYHAAQLVNETPVVDWRRSIASWSQMIKRD